MRGGELSLKQRSKIAVGLVVATLVTFSQIPSEIIVFIGLFLGCHALLQWKETVEPRWLYLAFAVVMIPMGGYVVFEPLDTALNQTTVPTGKEIYKDMLARVFCVSYLLVEAFNLGRKVSGEQRAPDTRKERKAPRLLLFGVVVFVLLALSTLAYKEYRHFGWVFVWGDTRAFSGQAHVIDGDTLLFTNGPLHLHLYGVDAPERNQICKGGERCGEAAYEALKEKIEGRIVWCSGKKLERYYRAFVECRLANSEPSEPSINEWMVREGWAKSVSTEL